MTKDEIDLISDAIKILGPALITGFVGYYAAKLQFVSKLKELDKTNEFRAREYYFNYYKDVQKEITGPADSQLINTLSALLSSCSDGALPEERKDRFLDIAKGVEETSMRMKVLLENRNLTGESQFVRLTTNLDRVKQLQIDCQEDIRKEFVESVRALQMSNGECVHLIEQKNMEHCFGKYFAER